VAVVAPCRVPHWPVLDPPRSRGLDVHPVTRVDACRARFAFYSLIAVALTYLSAWYAVLLYWIVPYCTWHITTQYMRLICEHSAVESDQDEYSITRTTIPTFIDSIFILPCNVGYHLEHHWYPSVPFYRLPQLHQALMERESFRQHAVVWRSVLTSLGECVRQQERDFGGLVDAKRIGEMQKRWLAG
jgi:fatty acid desaturase